MKLTPKKRSSLKQNGDVRILLPVQAVSCMDKKAREDLKIPKVNGVIEPFREVVYGL